MTPTVTTISEDYADTDKCISRLFVTRIVDTHPVPKRVHAQHSFVLEKLFQFKVVQYHVIWDWSIPIDQLCWFLSGHTVPKLKPEQLNRDCFKLPMLTLTNLFVTHFDYQDYQDPSVDSTVTDGHRQGKKA